MVQTAGTFSKSISTGAIGSWGWRMGSLRTFNALFVISRTVNIDITFRIDLVHDNAQ